MDQFILFHLKYFITDKGVSPISSIFDNCDIHLWNKTHNIFRTYRGRSFSSEHENSESEQTEKSPLVNAKLETFAKMIFSRTALTNDSSGNSSMKETYSSPTRCTIPIIIFLNSFFSWCIRWIIWYVLDSKIISISRTYIEHVTHSLRTLNLIDLYCLVFQKKRLWKLSLNPCMICNNLLIHNFISCYWVETLILGYC